MSHDSMKSSATTVFLLCISVLFLPGCHSEPAPQSGAQLKTELREYAAEPKDGHVKYRFKLMSVGSEPLEVTRVDSSCGCTVAETSKTTIQPGETAYIDADLTVAPNRRDSTVYVHTNDPAQDIILFRIAALGVKGAQLTFVPAVLQLKGSPGELLTGKAMLQLSVWKPVSKKAAIDHLKFNSSTKDFVVSCQESLTLPDKSNPAGDRDQKTNEEQVALYSHADRDVFLIPVTYQIQLASKPYKQRFYTSAQLGDLSDAPKALLSVVATVQSN